MRAECPQLQHTRTVAIPWLGVHLQLPCWKLLRYAVLVTAFEIVFEVLDTELSPTWHWPEVLMLTPILLLGASVLFFFGLRENCVAAFISLDANDVDLSAALVQKAEILPSLITKAAYGAVVEALHNLPDRIGSWEDLMKTLESLHQFGHRFVSSALQNYRASLVARNFPSPIILDAFGPQRLAMLKTLKSDPSKVLDLLPRELPHRRDTINIATSLHQSLHLLSLQISRHSELETFASKATSLFHRSCELFCHPSQFAIVFLNFLSLVHSFWEGILSGPEVILPMSSPMKRPSLRLSRLLLHHSRDISQHEFGVDVSSSGSSQCWTVAVVDLNAVPREIAKGTYSTRADIHGFACMHFLMHTLNFLFSPSWFMLLGVPPRIMLVYLTSTMFGDGTLTLLPSSEGRDMATPGYALLLDEEFTVILRGTENLVEAITQKGFHFLYAGADVFQVSMWKAGVNLLLEGWFQGLSYLLAILLPWRLIHPSFTSPLPQLIAYGVLMNSFMIITSFGSLMRRAPRRPNNDSATRMVQYLAEFSQEIIRSVPRIAPIIISWFLYIHDYSVFNELQGIVDLVALLFFPFILSVRSQNYPIRTAKFLDVLGNPPTRKWQFKTLAATATFQCLVICHDTTRRPIREIDVRGVLETLIPDQRAVWAAWKERVADRIIHEAGEISFAPTLPTFRAARFQKRLELYLGEAQEAYNAYRRWSDGLTPVDKRGWVHHCNDQLLRDPSILVDAPAYRRRIPSADHPIP